MYVDLIGVGNEPILADGYPLFNFCLIREMLLNLNFQAKE